MINALHINGYNSQMKFHCYWRLWTISPRVSCHVSLLSFFNRLYPLQWRHNEHDGVSNHQPHDCLLTSLFRRRSKKTSKLRVSGLRVGNSPVNGEFLAQRTSNVEIASIWWRHHDMPNSQLVKQVYNQLYRLHKQGFSNWMAKALNLSRIYDIDVTGVNRCFRDAC